MSFFSVFQRLIGALPDMAWFGKMGAQLLGSTFSGHDAPDDASPVAKGLSGMFGYKDEREMLILFEKLEQRQAGAAEVVNTFLSDHYSTEKPGLSFSAKQYIKLQRGRFRSVVIDMGESKLEKIGKCTIVIDGKTPEGGTLKSTSEKDIHNEHKNNSLDLFLRMYNILSSPGKTPEERSSLCLKHLSSAVANIPLVDPKMVAWLNKTEAATISKAGAVAPAVAQQAKEMKRLAEAGGRQAAEETKQLADRLEIYTRERTQQKSGWQKFIEWLF